MSTLPLIASRLDPHNAIHRKVVPAGEGWTHALRDGQVLRIVDLHGNQAADTLFFSADDPTDHYSAQNTICAQANIYLTTGTRLLSSAGHVLLTIVADTCGRHDTLGGACSTESNQVRYDLAKGHMHACRQSFVKAAMQCGFGLSKRDIASNINFFMNVPVTPEGALTFEDGLSFPGAYVELRAEMDVLAMISNCPQLNNPCNAYDPTPIEVLVWDAPHHV